MRCVGTVVRGIRTPIIKENDDLATIVVDSLMAAKESENFEFKDKDIVAITEAVVGISEGNYVTVDDVAEDFHFQFMEQNYSVPWSDIICFNTEGNNASRSLAVAGCEYVGPSHSIPSKNWLSF